jgi:site-specific DNA recombinase
VRPGLEALRDLAAQGEIEAVLVYSPDRLSRKYAYQVVLAEELSRYGVALVFLQAPSGETAEDHLLVQFQGMIAEYERAQILERYRRGKRHKAQIGVVSVLSGAPYVIAISRRAILPARAVDADAIRHPRQSVAARLLSAPAGCREAAQGGTHCGDAQTAGRDL